MSGSSSDPNVNVTITATDAGFVATTKAAQAAVAAWAQITGQASQTAAQASVNYQQLINSTTGVTGAHREAAASAEVFRKALGDATNEVKQLRSNMEGTSGSIVDGTKRAAAGTSNITRELVVLGHEAMTGRFSRIPGSLVVLSEYLGQASLAVTGLIAGFAMAAIAAERLVVWMGKINDLKTGVQAAGAFFNPDVDQSKLTDIAMKFRQLKDVTTEDSQQVVAAYARMKGATIETIQALVDETQRYAQATGEKLPAAAEHIKAAFEAPSAEGAKFLNDINASSDAIARFNAVTGDNQAAQRRIIMLQALDEATSRVSKTAQASRAQLIEDSMATAPGPSSLVADMLPSPEAITQQYDEIDQITKDREARRVAIQRDAIANMSTVEKQVSAQTPTWFERQTEGADELRAKVIGAESDYKKAHLDEATALAAYWQNAEQQAIAGSKDQMRAHEQYLRYKEQQDLLSLKLSTDNNKSELEAQIASLTAQQKVEAEHKDVVLSLEHQKLELLKAAYGERSKQYQEELGRMAEMERRFAQQEVAAAEEALRSKEKLDATEFASKVKFYNAQVAADKLSKDEAINQLKELVTANASAELQIVDDLIKTLDKGTAAYQKAMDQRAQIQARANAQLQNLDSQRVTDEAKANDRIVASYESMFANIGQTAQSTTMGLIQGTTTFQQAESRLLSTVLTDFINMTLHRIAAWTAMELTNTGTTAQHAVIRAQEEGGTGLGALIATTIEQWLGLETTKTAITTTQAGARTAAQTAADGAQQAAQTAANADTLIQSKIMATSEIEAAAGVAGANAFAATAAIPIVGPELAPAAAAAAVAQVQAMNSLVALDVGTTNVPQDMPAYIHKGEMVVPADFASGLRSGDLSLGGSSSSNHLSYAPTINAGGGGISRSEIAALLTRTSQEMYAYMQDIGRNGNLTLPGRRL